MDDKKIIIGFECRKGLTRATYGGYHYSNVGGLIRTLFRECGYNYHMRTEECDGDRVKFFILIQDEKFETEFSHSDFSDYTYSEAVETLGKIKDMLHWARNLPEWSVEFEI